MTSEECQVMMPPSVSNQQESWQPATPAYFGIDEGSGHGTKHHSQSSWEGEKFSSGRPRWLPWEVEGISGKAVCPFALLELEATLAPISQDCGKNPLNNAFCINHF